MLTKNYPTINCYSTETFCGKLIFLVIKQILIQKTQWTRKDVLDMYMRDYETIVQTLHTSLPGVSPLNLVMCNAKRINLTKRKISLSSFIIAKYWSHDRLPIEVIYWFEWSLVVFHAYDMTCIWSLNTCTESIESLHRSPNIWSFLEGGYGNSVCTFCCFYLQISFSYFLRLPSERKQWSSTQIKTRTTKVGGWFTSHIIMVEFETSAYLYDVI